MNFPLQRFADMLESDNKMWFYLHRFPQGAVSAAVVLLYVNEQERRVARSDVPLSTTQGWRVS